LGGEDSGGEVSVGRLGVGRRGVHFVVFPDRGAELLLDVADAKVC
jgi:hypothetical protein